MTIDKETMYALNPTLFLQIMARELQLQTCLDPRLGEKEREGGTRGDELTLADDGGATTGWSSHTRSKESESEKVRTRDRRRQLGFISRDMAASGQCLWLAECHSTCHHRLL